MLPSGRSFRRGGDSIPPCRETRGWPSYLPAASGRRPPSTWPDLAQFRQQIYDVPDVLASPLRTGTSTVSSSGPLDAGENRRRRGLSNVVRKSLSYGPAHRRDRSSTFPSQLNRGWTASSWQRKLVRCSDPSEAASIDRVLRGLKTRSCSAILHRSLAGGSRHARPMKRTSANQQDCPRHLGYFQSDRGREVSWRSKHGSRWRNGWSHPSFPPRPPMNSMSFHLLR